ncbi:bifunctional 3-deoxy-7-phosphoheptulonate synthase/chorismate mutase [Paenibacillus sp. MAHUQ-46]|uniref:Bifunctional 3-deoxy-7-phosphoheptulonate synthase/chorismate mutase n=2 Tax=Paenibacillus TaxID=44249 RepID=A0A934J0B4_9BACL|nr:bifunctional 3-deoxy-7-phosphoheptulonate synthase/chorismate mutase [Paenibacillus roseus]MBJ6360375.1 bifunctional 3-deoxy-7-phosphoheptulonate synthase/chorismate mutase [Paenibacillus roseus]
MNQNHTEVLERQLRDVSHQMLELVQEQVRIVQELKLSPSEMQELLDKLAGLADEKLEKKYVRDLFGVVLGITTETVKAKERKPLLVSRVHQQEDTIIDLGEVRVGGGTPVMVAGPCAVESYEQVRQVAAVLKAAGVTVLRGGAFKPRTSPYEFQGLGIDGLKILKEVAAEFGMQTISEIVHPAHVELAGEYIDVIQIGARNMQNFELLKAAGEVQTPVLLKRGLAATLEEFLHAAEYIVSRGNRQVMLIERGIRTYERATRNTLDISAVPILKQESHLPVLVDVTHSTGRKEIMAPCAKAALAAGADGVMVEVHPNPAAALSDAAQQLDFEAFGRFYAEVKRSGLL